MVGIFRLQLQEQFGLHLLGHRAACFGIRQNDTLLRRENLHRFGHKPYAAHQHGFGIRLGRLLAQSERIANIISHFPNVVALVGVRQNADSLFFFQANDFRLQFTCQHKFKILWGKYIIYFR